MTAYTIAIVQNSQTVRNQASLETPLRAKELLTAHFNLAILEDQKNTDTSPDAHKSPDTTQDAEPSASVPDNQTYVKIPSYRPDKDPNDGVQGHRASKRQVSHVALQTDTCDTLYVTKNTLTAYTIAIVQNSQTVRNQASLETPVRVEELLTAHFNLAILEDQKNTDTSPDAHKSPDTTQDAEPSASVPDNQTYVKIPSYRPDEDPNDGVQGHRASKRQVRHVALQTDTCDTLYVTKNTLTAYTIAIVQNSQALQYDKMHTALQTVRNQASLETPVRAEELFDSTF